MSGTASPDLRSLLRSFRERQGFSQQGLAERVGVSRQALIAIEAGRQVPSTTLALQLARELDCKVEELFTLPSSQKLVALPAMRLSAGAITPFNGRVALGRVDGRLVAHPLEADQSGPADAVVVSGTFRPEGVEVDLLTEPRALDSNVLVAGCAPLLGLLAQRVSSRHDHVRATWLPCNNQRSLQLLEPGLVHVAGVHTSFGKGRLAMSVLGKAMAHAKPLVVNLTCWRLGFVVAPGNPHEIRDPADLSAPGLRVVQREAGSGADHFFRSLVKRYRIPVRVANTGPMVTTHAQVAQLVQCGVADVGITIEACAVAAGLGFIPLTEERFDLILPRERLENPAVSRLFDVLNTSVFRSEVAALPGYDNSSAGQTIGIAES